MTNKNRLYSNRKVSDIFHPTDFSEGSGIAFVHALKLALASKSVLSLLQVYPNGSDEWHDFPGVRETLERWKLIPPRSPKNVVAELGIDVHKITATSSDPVKACLDYLEIHTADLVVLAVHEREGIMGWLGKSVGESLARNSQQMTLFIPGGVSGFVSREDGSITLRNILIPVADKPDPQPAVEAVLRLIESLELPPGTVTLLRVSPAKEFKPVNLPEKSDWTWNELVMQGEPAHVILQTAEKLNADLIVMTTDGPDGFLDGLRGTTSERVLRRAKCPVGSLPVDSLLG